ncbi:MAG: DNA polymerase III subunit delta [Planctomycetaceae bacterium]|nr:DNA polymerase III subunit delta [Planctomycetaceae bacterium]
MKPVSVHDYLWNVGKFPAMPVCVVFGDDAYLRANAVRHIRDQVLAGEDAEFAMSLFEGDTAAFKDVYRELHTTAMFGGGRRVVRVDDADSFVTKNRAELENYVAKPSHQTVLILQLKTFASNTNLYKKLVGSGLIIEAKTLTDKEMPNWVAQWAKHHYKMPCDPAAAAMIVERVGLEHGLLDQELAKLSLMVADSKGITPELVEQAVGSWRSRTAFEMLDLALEGKTTLAVRQLNALILAGENAVGILAQISATLRKLAAATEIILNAERQRGKISVRAALEQAGVKGFFLNKTEKQLLHIGRQRGVKLSQWLLQLDLDLKGESRSEPRLLLEMFLVKISQTPGARTSE